MTAQADYFAAGAAQTISGSTFRIHRGKEEFAATIRLPGEHNIRNALSAFACARELGIPPRTVLEGLADLERIPGRLDPVSAGQSFSVCVDFAHTESALSSVLDSLNLLPHRKIITVFGCGGDRDKSKRGPMGAAACAGSDIAIATSDNPRSEDPMEILKAVEKGMHEGGYDNYRIIPDRKEAIYEAIKIAQKDDIVLIAGKGHETVQYVGEQALHFDDAQTARDALKDCARI
jgi:UDP-N-acetylmuramoyl-L-alanyl-D-glutamate--2,6-diaminopimelate ligase